MQLCTICQATFCPTCFTRLEHIFIHRQDYQKLVKFFSSKCVSFLFFANAARIDCKTPFAEAATPEPGLPGSVQIKRLSGSRERGEK